MSCFCIKGKEQSPHCGTHAALQRSRGVCECGCVCVCVCSHPIWHKSREGLSYISLDRWKLRCECFSISSDFRVFQESLHHFTCPNACVHVIHHCCGSFSKKQTPWLGTCPAWSNGAFVYPEFQLDSTFEDEKCQIINPVSCIAFYWTS